MKLLVRSFVLSMLVAGGLSSFAQPCISGFKYRLPVVVDNTGNSSALTNFQVKLVLNTQDLVVSGKMQANGGDLRLRDKTGNSLSFWIENGTMNQPTTVVWVKMPSIAASSADTIYAFYGRESASSLSNGSTTFDFFDDFNGSILNAAIWDDCGGGDITVAGGTLTLSSSSSATNIHVKSATSFSGQVRSEAKVTSVSQGVALLGQVNANDSGWAMGYEQLVTNNKVMRLVSLRPDGTATSCLTAEDQAPLSNAVNALNTLGTWSMAWHGDSTQSLTWPGGTLARTDNRMSAVFADSKKLLFGNFSNAGSIVADWVRVRKYTSVDPILTLGTEAQLVDEVTISNDGPYCQGDTMRLSAPTFAGATYNWFGPSGFTSSDEDPIIDSVTLAENGKFFVEVSLPNGCNPEIDSTEVSVSDNTVSGTLSGTTTLCLDSNSGAVSLSGNVGDVQHWESASALGGPWSTISITASVLNYSELGATQYYRTIIKSGVCERDTTNIVKVTIDASTEGGFLTGDATKCKLVNTGTLNLYNRVGTILRWQSSDDNGGTWDDITNATTQQSFTNLDTTRLYRVEVQNGVCPATFSDTASIVIVDNPVADFDVDVPCQGTPNMFTSTSSINSGYIQNYIWTYSDANGSSAVNPSHSFASAGTHSAELIVVSNLNCTDTISKPVMVVPNPVAAFSFADVCDTVAVAFTDQSSIAGGAIATYTWSFGDGNSANTDDSNYVYASPGAYDVKHVVVSDSGCADSVTQSVSVFPRAYVGFTSSDNCFGTPTEFQNTTLFDPQLVNYDWSFGDGNTSTAIQATHTYQDTGKFVVTLQSTTLNGCLDFFTDTVEVFSVPTAAYTVDDECIYDSLAFINQSSIDAGSVTYAWTFGDGENDSTASPKHRYAEVNSFYTTLTVTSDNGCTDQTGTWVKTYPKPTANYSYEKICETFPTPFTNASTTNEGALSYAWDFDDPNSGVLNADSLVDPEHVFSKEGFFNVRLIATTDFGCVDTLHKTVQVFPLPNTLFSYTEVCDGFPTPFHDSTSIDTGYIESYVWDFGDATSAILQNPNHLFLNWGDYDVNLKTKSDRGCIHDTTITIHVDEVPLANFQVEDVCWSEPILPVNESFISQGLMTYAWTFGDGNIDSVENPEHTYQESDLYPIKLVATSQDGCVDSLLKYVETYALPTVNAGIDTSISQGFETQLMGTATAGEFFTWTPTTGMANNAIADPIVRPLETTTYTLLAIDSNGCQAEDQVTVEVIEDFKLLVQNLITPNGDGINDQWLVINAETFDLLNLFVYDRYGSEVLSQKGYNSDWGAVRGIDQLPDGTYYYVITFDNSERVYKGSISVMRNQ